MLKILDLFYSFFFYRLHDCIILLYHSFALKNVNYIFFRNGDTGGRISRYSLLSILSQLQNIDCTVNNKVGYIKTRLVKSSTVSHCLSHSNSTLKPFNRLMKIILYRDLLPIENINFTDQGFMIYMHTRHWLDIGNRNKISAIGIIHVRGYSEIFCQLGMKI